MKKKWLAMLLSLAMVLSLLPTWAIAVGEDAPDGAVAYVTDAAGQPVGTGDEFGEEPAAVAGYYKNLKDAFAAAGDGDTVTLVADGSYACANNVITIPANSERIFDLNGHNLTVTGATYKAADRLFDVLGTLNIVDNGESKGVLMNSSKSGVFIVVNGNATLTATGVAMSATENRDLIFTNGTSSPVNITLTDCTFNGRCYFPAGGTYTIDGGTYAGRCGAFEFKCGTINILDGNFSATATDGDWFHYGNGSVFTGDGVIIEACNYPSGNPVVNITGGTFTGGTPNNDSYKNYGLLVIDYLGNEADMTGTSVPYTLARVNTKYESTSGPYYHFTDENTELVTPIAQVGDDKYYPTLADAIDAAQTGATIKLLDDVTDNVTIPAGATVTLDLNGKTINGGNQTTAAGKAAITNGGNLTITGRGTVKREDTGAKAYYVIENKVGATMHIVDAIVSNNSGDFGSGASLVDNGGTMVIDNLSFTQENFIVIKNEDTGDLTINNGTFDNKGYYEKPENKCGISSAVQNWGTAVINGGNFSGGISTMTYGSAAKTTINGGTFTNCSIWLRNYKNDNFNPELTIAGGDFTLNATKGFVFGANYSDTKGSEVFSITGGTFSQKPDATLLATGYEATEESGTWTVAKAKPIHVEEPAKDEFTNTTGDENIVTELTNNAAMTKEIETGIDELVKSGTAGAVADGVKTELTKNLSGDTLTAVVNAVDAGAFVTYVSVKPEKAEEAEWVESGVKLTFDVKPMIKVNVGGGVEASLTPEMVGSTNTFDTPVTFRLPLTSDFTKGQTVMVTHYQEEPDEDGAEVFYTEVKEEDGGLYVELMFYHFSEVDVQPASEDMGDLVVCVGSKGYDDSAESIAAAIREAVTTGQTLEVIADEPEKYTLSVRTLAAGETLNVKLNGATLLKVAGTCLGTVNVTDATNPEHTVVLSAVADKTVAYKVNEPVTVSLIGTDNGGNIASYLGVHAVIEYDPTYLELDTTNLPTGWTAGNGVVEFYTETAASGLTDGVISTLTFKAKAVTKATEAETDDGTPISVTKASAALTESGAFGATYYNCTAGADAVVKIEAGKRQWAVGHNPDDNGAYADPVETYNGSPIPFNAVNYFTAETGDVKYAQVDYFTKTGDSTYSKLPGAPTDAGEYFIQFYVLADGTYEELRCEDYHPYTINKATLYIDTACAVDTPVYTGAKVRLLKGDVEAYADEAMENLVNLESVTYTVGTSATQYTAFENVKSNAVATDGPVTVHYTAVPENNNYATAEGEFSVTINEPAYTVVTLNDYVGGGGKLVLVFTDGDARFTCGGNKMYDITDFGYNTAAKSTEYGRTNGALTTVTPEHTWRYVYARLVGGDDNAEVVVVSKTKSNAGILYVSAITDGKYDINSDGAIDVSDAVAALLSNNKGVTYSAEELKDYMATILRADVCRDGAVGADDVAAIRDKVKQN